MSVLTIPGTATELELLSSRSLYVPAPNALVLADLHVGKAEHFRRNGIPVPEATNTNDLRRLNDLVQQRNADVFIVGDLVHSTKNTAWDEFAKMISSWQHAVHLVVGNHDRHVESFANEIGLTTSTTHTLGDVLLVHDEADAPSETPVICGHLHPAIRLPLGVGGSVRLPCFHLRGRVLTLPAFSQFTGAATITPHSSDRVWVEVDGKVEEVDVGLLD